MEKYLRLFYFVSVLIVILSLTFKFFQNDAGVIVALIVGAMAMIHVLIRRWVFPPIFELNIKMVPTPTSIGVQQKWFHLSIKNIGFSEAHNVRVKVRDNSNKSWVNLRRPFANLREETDRTTIRTLSSGEEEAFDIGFTHMTGGIFEMVTDIAPNNQIFDIANNQTQIYFIEVVADSASPLKSKLKINNPNNGMDVDNLKLTRAKWRHLKIINFIKEKYGG